MTLFRRLGLLLIVLRLLGVALYEDFEGPAAMPWLEATTLSPL
jgi:hypothetical protein